MTSPDCVSRNSHFQNPHQATWNEFWNDRVEWWKCSSSISSTTAHQFRDEYVTVIYAAYGKKRQIRWHNRRDAGCHQDELSQRILSPRSGHPLAWYCLPLLYLSNPRLIFCCIYFFYLRLLPLQSHLPPNWKHSSHSIKKAKGFQKEKERKRNQFFFGSPNVSILTVLPSDWVESCRLISWLDADDSH